MSVRRLAPADVQPASFAFSNENQAFARQQIAKYPEGRQASAVIPLLWEAQKQAGGWLPRKAIEHVADLLGMAHIRVLEVATFYTMFNLAPVGRHFIQLCGTTPCALRGAEKLKDVLRQRIGDQNHVTADGKFSWLEVECLGACCNAPMVQINDDFYEDLTPESLNRVMDDLAAGKAVKPGPQNGRHSSEPEGAVKTLVDSALYDGSVVGAWKTAFDERVARARAAKEEAAKAAAAPAAAPATAPVAAVPPPAAAPAPVAAPVAAAQTDLFGGKAPAKGAPKAPVERKAKAEDKPPVLDKPRDGAGDDLKLIWGVGPKLEQMLHGMGVFHFDQIAAWTDKQLEWVDENLEGFYGRAGRDKWIDQSKKLATGWRPSKAEGEKPV